MTSLTVLTRLATQALKRAGATKAMAEATARALVSAEAQGLSGHGLQRLALYCDHLRQGRALGKARPRVVHQKGATALVDAGGGLAFLACEKAVQIAIRRARKLGVSFVGVCKSHHMGALADHLVPIASAGMVGLAFSNSPSAINAWGGKKAFYGTNPIAAIFPRQNAEPVVIDLSLTEVTRGKIMVYAKAGRPIPLGWAVDRLGQPTTDAQVALSEGSLNAIGGVKGAALALMVELLCVALTGAACSFENDSYFEPGNKPDIGHAILAINPLQVMGTNEIYFERVETLIMALLDSDGVRLPGARRHEALAKAKLEGLNFSQSQWVELRALAGIKKTILDDNL